MINVYNDKYFMKLALQEAQAAFDKDEVPIGAVVTFKNTIIGKGHNQVEQLQDPTAHAEMIAITAATNYVGAKFLTDCTLFITVEPCVMCAGAIKWSRIGKVVFGCREPRSGFLANHSLVLNGVEMVGGIEEEQAKNLMQEFFKQKRK